MDTIKEFHNSWVEKIKRENKRSKDEFFVTLSSIEEIQYATELKNKDNLPNYMKIEDGKVKVNVLTAPFNCLPFYWKDGIKQICELKYAIDLLYDGPCVTEDGKPAYPSNIKYASVNIPTFSEKNLNVLSMYLGEDHDYVTFAKYYMDKSKEEERTM